MHERLYVMPLMFDWCKCLLVLIGALYTRRCSSWFFVAENGHIVAFQNRIAGNNLIGF